MANGISYFPLDVHLEDNIALIEAEFGLTGFAVIVKLYQKIYGELGYYCEWTKDVALLFSRKLGGTAVSEIVEASIRREIFNKELYDKYSILTSKGIQKRYFEIVSRRKEVEVKKEYLLINITHKYKNVNILTENVNISKENEDIFKQSKVKESKEKKRKENNIDVIVSAYENYINPVYSPTVIELFKSYLNDGITQQLIVEAIEVANDNNKRNISYIKGILNNCLNNNIFTVEDFKRSNLERGKKTHSNNNLDWLEG